jgi:hypothetical protein
VNLSLILLLAASSQIWTTALLRRRQGAPFTFGCCYNLRGIPSPAVLSQTCFGENGGKLARLLHRDNRRWISTHQLLEARRAVQHRL